MHVLPRPAPPSAIPTPSWAAETGKPPPPLTPLAQIPSGVERSRMSGAHTQATLTLNLAPTRGNKSSRWREETLPWMPPLLGGPRAPTRYRASESSTRLTLCHSQRLEGRRHTEENFLPAAVTHTPGDFQGASGYLRISAAPNAFSEPPGSRQDFACLKTIVVFREKTRQRKCKVSAGPPAPGSSASPSHGANAPSPAVLNVFLLDVAWVTSQDADNVSWVW